MKSKEYTFLLFFALMYACGLYNSTAANNKKSGKKPNVLILFPISTTKK
jgi:hypothetical protein